MTEEQPAPSSQSDSSSSPGQLVLRGQHELVAASSLVGRGLSRVVRGEWREENVIGVLATGYGGLIVSPVGERLACNACHPDRHELSLFDRGIGNWFLARRLKFSSPEHGTASESSVGHARVPCHAWSPCGRYLATGSGSDSECWDWTVDYDETRILVFDTATGGCREVAFLNRDPVLMLAWSSSGEFLASVSMGDAPILRLWRCQWKQGSLGRELVSTELIGRWVGPPGMRIGGADLSWNEREEFDARGLFCFGATGVAFSNDEKFLAVVAVMLKGKGLLALLSVPGLEDVSRRPLTVPNGSALTLQWAHGDERLLVAGEGGVEVLDARLQSEAVLLERGRYSTRGYVCCSRAAWSGTGDYVCIGTSEGKYVPWQFPDDPPDRSWKGEMRVVAMADRRVVDARTISGGVRDVVWVPSRGLFRATTGSATIVEWRPPLC